MKVELLFNYKKKFRFKSLNKWFLRTNLKEPKSPFSKYFIYHYFYHGIFMFGNDSVSSSLLETLMFSLDDQKVVQDRGRIEFRITTGTGLVIQNEFEIVTQKWKNKSSTIELKTHSETSASS